MYVYVYIYMIMLCYSVLDGSPEGRQRGGRGTEGGADARHDEHALRPLL